MDKLFRAPHFRFDNGSYSFMKPSLGACICLSTVINVTTFASDLQHDVEEESLEFGQFDFKMSPFRSDLPASFSPPPDQNQNESESGSYAPVQFEDGKDSFYDDVPVAMVQGTPKFFGATFPGIPSAAWLLSSSSDHHRKKGCRHHHRTSRSRKHVHPTKSSLPTSPGDRIRRRRHRDQVSNDERRPYYGGEGVQRPELKGRITVNQAARTGNYNMREIRLPVPCVSVALIIVGITQLLILILLLIK